MESFKITPKSTTKHLVYLIGTLVVLHAIAMVLKIGLGYPTAWLFVPMFDLNGEKNIPAIYSSLAIIVCSIFLWRISMQKREQLKKQSVYWKMLSLIFLFLGLDEYSGIHERFLINDILGESATGFLHYNWFIPYLIIFGIIGLFFIKFLFQLPKKTRSSFIIAGSVFLLGAVGFEMIGGKFLTEGGGDDFFYVITFTLEECFEMMGIVLFINALMNYWLQEASVTFYLSKDERNPDQERGEFTLNVDQKVSYKASNQ